MIKKLVKPIIRNNNGFSLIELLAVLTILGILATIAVVSVTGIIEKSKQEVCSMNVRELERKYETHLLLESMEHSDVTFVQYFGDYDEIVCPVDGEIKYVDGRVQCSLHLRDGEVEEHDEVEESIPYL